MHFIGNLIILGLLVMLALFLANIFLTVIMVVIGSILAGIGWLWEKATGK